MGKLHYVTNVSADCYIEDAQGDFGFTEPTDEAFTFITDLVRPVDTWLYGRRLYESMAVWETDPALADQSALYAEFARVWQRGEKIVYSTTLEAASTERTRIERRFDADEVRAIKASVSGELAVGGAALAACAFEAGLVDECHLFVAPAILGGGKPAFSGDVRVELDLLDQRRFGNGVVYLRYGTRLP